MTLLFLILSGVSVTELILQMQSTTFVMHIYALQLGIHIYLAALDS